MKAIIKKHSPLLYFLIKECVHRLRLTVSYFRRRRFARHYGEIKLEIGSGPVKGSDGWITMDIKPKCDFYWDVRRGLPFPDESIQIIYSSHFLEHLTFAEAASFLSDSRRVLVPGGTFSVCVPNARLYMQAYIDGTTLPEDYFMFKPAYNGTTKIDYVNYTAYMNGYHRYMYDTDNLIHVLEKAGFTSVHIRDFDPNLDIRKRRFESICANALK